MKVRYYCEKCGKERPDRSEFYTSDVVITRAVQAEYYPHRADLDFSRSWDLCRTCAESLANTVVNNWTTSKEPS